jgi:hypothetical protein
MIETSECETWLLNLHVKTLTAHSVWNLDRHSNTKSMKTRYRKIHRTQQKLIYEFVNVSKSSEPERLNNICVANVSDQAAYC